MIKLFVKRIINKQSTLDEVPYKLRKQVIEMLIEKGYSDLIPIEYK